MPWVEEIGRRPIEADDYQPELQRIGRRDLDIDGQASLIEFRGVDVLHGRQHPYLRIEHAETRDNIRRVVWLHPVNGCDGCRRCLRLVVEVLQNTEHGRKTDGGTPEPCQRVQRPSADLLVLAGVENADDRLLYATQFLQPGARYGTACR